MPNPVDLTILKELSEKATQDDFTWNDWLMGLTSAWPDLYTELVALRACIREIGEMEPGYSMYASASVRFTPPYTTEEEQEVINALNNSVRARDEDWHSQRDAILARHGFGKVNE